MEIRREQPQTPQETEPLPLETEGPLPPTPEQQKTETEQRQYEKAAAGLEMSIEDTANALEGLVGDVDAAMKGKIVDALVENIRQIPEEKRQVLLGRVRGNIEQRVTEAQAQKMRPAELRKREANLELLQEIDSRLYTEMPEEDVIELTEVVDDEEPLELDWGDRNQRRAA